MLEIDNVFFDYLGKPVVENLSLHVDTGEIVAIIGPSGQGKTTLFRLIAGLERPKQGRIKAGPLSYMMQEDLLLPWKTALENVIFAYEVAGGPAQLDEALDLLQQVGLQGFENHYPRALSGGMKQRVALARTLVFQKPLLLLDEPFASVDSFRKKELYQLLLQIQVRYHLTLVLITHDLHDAFTFAHRIYYLNKGKLSLCKDKESLGEFS